MITKVQEIYDIEAYLTGYNSGLRAAQKTDDDYYYDTFGTPLIERPEHVVRSGRAAQLIDSPAEHIITSNPQVFVEPRKGTDQARKTAVKQARLYNHWLYQIKFNNPDPIKEFVKNLLRRGEAFYEILLNEDWDKEDEEDLPILFRVPDPMIVWAHPAEKKGIPECVIVRYKRLAWTVEARWPNWKAGNKKEVEWLQYVDKNVRYFEADKRPVTDGIEPNIHKVVNYVHAYSGLGKSSPDGKPEALAVSIIRLCRSLLLEECQVRSSIDSQMHLYTHPNIDLYAADDRTYTALEKEKNPYSVMPGKVHLIPPGVKVDKDRGIPPASEWFTHLAEIEARLDRFLPPVMQGIATSSRSSGRLEDILGRQSEYKYDTVVENTEKALATGLDIGRQIMINVPDMMPVTVNATVIKERERVREEELIKKVDLRDKHRIEVKLSAADPIEADRTALLFRSLYGEKIIDWRTCLMDGLGKTAEEAEDIIAQTIADQAVLQDVTLRNILVRRVMEKLGMQEELAAIQEEGARQEQMAQEVATQAGRGPEGGEPRTLNLDLTNPEALRTADMILSQRASRRPPSGTR